LIIQVKVLEVLLFRINRRTDYAIRVMVGLAKRPPGTRLSTQEIQDEMLVPRPFLQRIIADLSKEELIYTFMGPNGGVELARPAEAITLRHIWEAFEGPILISDCLKSPDVCPLDKGCPVHIRWERIQTILIQELESSTLHQLASDAHLLASKPDRSTAPTTIQSAKEHKQGVR
jgi:Rrf2 family protein